MIFYSDFVDKRRQKNSICIIKNNLYTLFLRFNKLTIKIAEIYSMPSVKVFTFYVFRIIEFRTTFEPWTQKATEQNIIKTKKIISYAAAVEKISRNLKLNNLLVVLH